MKKIITLLTVFFFSLSLFSFTPKDVDSAMTNLCKEIMFSQPQSYSQENYTELAYLKRNFDLNKIKINDSAYLSKIFNNYYYDLYYLYSKFLNESAVVTEDCLHIKESTENIHKANKLLIYAMYPNSIKLPNNIVEQIDEYATLDEFFGPYKMLNVIYYLKKYNYQNLNESQKDKLTVIENHLSKLFFNKYIDNKPWSYTKLLATKVLKMNNSNFVKDLDVSLVVDYFRGKQPLKILDVDMKSPYLSTIGSNNMIQQQGIAALWIFLLEFK